MTKHIEINMDQLDKVNGGVITLTPEQEQKLQLVLKEKLREVSESGLVLAGRPLRPGQRRRPSYRKQPTPLA